MPSTLSGLVDTRPGYRSLTGTSGTSGGGGGILVQTKQGPSTASDMYVRSLGGSTYDVSNPMDVYFPYNADGNAEHAEGFTPIVVIKDGKRKYDWGQQTSSFIESVMPQAGLQDPNYEGRVLKCYYDSATQKYMYRFEDQKDSQCEWLYAGNRWYAPGGLERKFISAYDTVSYTSDTSPLAILTDTTFNTTDMMSTRVVSLTSNSSVLIFGSVFNNLPAPSGVGVSPQGMMALRAWWPINAPRTYGSYYIEWKVRTSEGRRTYTSPIFHVEADFDPILMHAPGQTVALETTTKSANTALVFDFPHDIQLAPTSYLRVEYTTEAGAEFGEDITNLTRTSPRQVTATVNTTNVKNGTAFKMGMYNILDEWGFRLNTFSLGDVQVLTDAVPSFTGWTTSSVPGYTRLTAGTITSGNFYSTPIQLGAEFSGDIFQSTAVGTTPVTCSNGTISVFTGITNNRLSFIWTPGAAYGSGLKPATTFTFTFATSVSTTDVAYTVEVTQYFLNPIPSGMPTAQKGTTISALKLHMPIGAATMTNIRLAEAVDASATSSTTTIATLTGSFTRLVPSDVSYAAQHDEFDVNSFVIPLTATTGRFLHLLADVTYNRLLGTPIVIPETIRTLLIPFSVTDPV